MTLNAGGATFTSAVSGITTLGTGPITATGSNTVGGVTLNAGGATFTSAVSGITTLGTGPITATGSNTVGGVTLNGGVVTGATNVGNTAGKDVVFTTTGISGSNGGALKHTRVTGLNVAAATSTAFATAFTWTPAFGDASYTITCSLNDNTPSTTAGKGVRAVVQNITASKFDLYLMNDDTAAHNGITADCIAIHD